MSLMIGATEMGTGAATTATAMICAEELGVDLDDVDVICSDSETIPADFGTYGSRVTTLSGNAVRDACAQVREQLFRVASEALEVPAEALELGDHSVRARDDHSKSMDLATCVQSSLFRDRDGRQIMAQSHYDAPCSLPDPETGVGDFAMSYSFGAHAVEVEVDEETGHVRIVDFVAATDCGNLVNPALAESQVEGGAAQGIGYGLMEDLVVEEGQVMNPRFDLPDPDRDRDAADALAVGGDQRPARPVRRQRARRDGPGADRSGDCERGQERDGGADHAHPAHAGARALGARLQRRGGVMRYLEPTTVDEALGALAEHGEEAKVLAGGQSLLVMMRERLVDPDVLIGLNGIGALRSLETNGEAVIGAMARQWTSRVGGRGAQLAAGRGRGGRGLDDPGSQPRDAVRQRRARVPDGPTRRARWWRPTRSCGWPPRAGSARWPRRTSSSGCWRRRPTETSWSPRSCCRHNPRARGRPI